MIRVVGRHVWREGLGLLAGLGLGLMAGFSWWSSFVLGIAVAAFVVAATGLEPEEEPDWERERNVRPNGSRGDLQDLAWSIVGRDGRAGERAMRRLRETARVRLARHGVDVTDPGQADAVAALVGRRAAATLARRSAPLPSVADLAHTIAALEALGPRPPQPDALAGVTTGPSVPGPDAQPDGRTDHPRAPRTRRNR